MTWSTERVTTLLCETDLPCLFNEQLLLGYQSVSESQIEQWANEAIERRNDDTKDAPIFDPRRSDERTE